MDLVDIGQLVPELASRARLEHPECPAAQHLPGSRSHQWLAMAIALTQAISSEIGALYARVYGHDRATATTYINDNVVLCVLENILTEPEATLIDAGSSSSRPSPKLPTREWRHDSMRRAQPP